MAAAGTRPKSDSTEYRPPMFGHPKKMCRKPSPSATCCIFEWGSVMATKRLPASFWPTSWTPDRRSTA
jgi:hypothetical protein